MSTVFVEYVGTKPKRTDSIAGTGVVWSGAGDVQAVPADAWAKLSRHPDVWRLVDGPVAKPVPPEIAAAHGELDSEPVVDGEDLEALDRDQLVAIATAQGLKLRGNASAESLRALLKGG
jgi:hypothetical protein